MDYGDILKKSYQLTKKHKILWLLGMLIGGGSSCGGNYSFGDLNDTDFGRDLSDKFDFSVFIDYWYIIALIILLLGLFVLVVMIISIMARGGMYHGVKQAQEDKKVSFKESFIFGARKFWRVLGIQLIMAAAIGAVVFVLILPAALLFIIPIIGWIVGAILIFLAILIILALSLVFALLINFVNCYAVLEDKKIIESIKSGWNLLKKNLGDSIIMALILFGIGLGAGIVILISLFFVLAIFGGIGFLAYLVFKWIGVAIVIGVALLILTIIGLFLKGILNVFTYSCWVYTWKELIDKK